jgi:hypothetical protein
VTELTNAPASAPPGPAQLQPWAIVVIVLVVAGCACFGVLGLLLAFGDPILQQLGLTSLLLPAAGLL